MATLKSGLNSGAGFNSSDTITSTTLNNHVNDGGIVAGTIATADMADSSSKITGVTFAKMQHIDAEKVLARTTAGEGDIEEIDIAGASGILLDEDTMSSDSATRGATQQSIKAYVDDNAYKESLLIFNGTTPISIADKDTDANGTQCTLEFEHLYDSAQASDPDTAATDINDAGITLSSNEFTLPEGTYDITVNATVTLNNIGHTDPGTNVVAFLKRKLNDTKFLISNVARQVDNVSTEGSHQIFIKGRIVIPNSPATNSNIFDLRFSADDANKAEIGSNSHFESFTPTPNHVIVSIVKIKG